LQARLGRRIAEARRAREISQVELAKAVGASERSVQNWEAGARWPSKRGQLERIADALGRPVDWFIAPDEQVAA
jgi:transcriptional regulator with XRE-family HTH domain